jgi:hypothetical protein
MKLNQIHRAREAGLMCKQSSPTKNIDFIN